MERWQQIETGHFNGVVNRLSESPESLGRRIPQQEPGKTEGATRRHETWIAAATIIGAGIAAWIHLKNGTIWYDEAITLLTTAGHAGLDWPLGMQQFRPTADLGKILKELYQQDVHPPLFFWILALWRVTFGASLEVARALSALFSLGTLALLYRYARDVGMRWASVPVVVYAVSAVGLRYAYNARPYAMATFLIVLTLVLAHRKSKWTGICAAASVATHYFSALCVGPILAIECAAQWKPNRRWVLLTLSSFAAFCAPLLPLLRVHVGARPNQFPEFGAFSLEFWSLLKNAIAGIMPSTWLPKWGIALVVGGALVIAGARKAIKENEAKIPLMYGAFLCGFVVLAMATNKSIASMPGEYYLGIAAPLLALLLGFGAAALPRAMPLLALILLAGTVTAKRVTHETDYREMMTQIRAKCSACPILVGVGYNGAIPACVLYEAKGMKVLLLHANDTPEEMIKSAGRPRTIMLVPTYEPDTEAVEQKFVRTYPAVRKNGYFEVEVAGGGER